MIKFMVDSSSDLRNQSDLYDYFIPISVNMDGKEYLDGIDLDNEFFYHLLLETNDFPKTSQPSPQAFLHYFEEVKVSKDELIYFALSSGLSGTYQSAMLAKELVDYDDIYIIDTLAASHLIGVLVKFAIKLREQKFSVKEIIEKCESLKTKIKVFAGIDTLEYLRRGGRLSNASAMVGTLTNIKPIISVTSEGKVTSIYKALGKARAMQFLLNKINSYTIDPDFPICSLYSSGEENCEALEHKLTSNGYCIKERCQIGSTIGAHTGPCVYGIVFVKK